MKEKNKSFTPNNIDTTIETFELAVKTDTKEHNTTVQKRYNLTKEEQKALAHLSKRDDIIITRADKGGATVIWGIEEYLNEVNNHLKNTEFYQELNHDPFEDFKNLITNSLKEMLSNDLIDKETLEILKPVDVKPARFYLIPKIHKKNNPGRPVISSVNCHTSKLSKYVDHFIQPLAQKVKSYIRDTTDLLNKIKDLGELPKNSILVTMDVRSLYTNIKHEDGISALKKSLDRRVNKEPPTEVITTLITHILTLNNFTFNGKNYLQMKGCAMGTVCAPSYATIYMGEFEETFIYPEIKDYCKFYARYMDDIFFIYTGGEEKLHDFLTNLNTKHISIKFDHEKSQQRLSFLDTLIYIDDDGKLQTTLYTKPTDTHNYLHYKSAHPKHLKDSLPYSQSLRLRRICSNETEFKKHNSDLKKKFLVRGYNEKTLDDEFTRASSKTRDDTLKLTEKSPSNRIPFVTTFNHSAPPVSKIIKSRWNILQIKPDLKNMFNDAPITAYKRPKNIKDFIGGNIIINDKVKLQKASKPPSKIGLCQPCNIRNSQCCKQVLATNEFQSSVTKQKFKIFHKTNCKSIIVIYLLECKHCSKQYIGKSEWPFNIRLNNYRHRIQTTDRSKLLNVERHFLQPDHNFTQDARFTIIEKIEKIVEGKATETLEKHEDMWMMKLKTLPPNGLNIRLNNPHNISLT